METFGQAQWSGRETAPQQGAPWCSVNISVVPLKDSRPARQLGWLASAAATLVLLQLLPLPPVVWPSPKSASAERA